VAAEGAGAAAVAAAGALADWGVRMMQPATKIPKRAPKGAIQPGGRFDMRGRLANSSASGKLGLRYCPRP
jgi:hypothetical protein